MRPLSLAPDADPAPDTGLLRVDDVTVDARVLVITADGTDASADAIIETLRYLGTPFDVLNASTGPTLTPDALAVGDHGRYYGVVLDVGDLAAGNQSAFTDEEWMTLASYEARFGVRRAVMYAYPTDAYGLTSTGGFDVSTKPIIAHCTRRGQQRVRGRELRRPARRRRRLGLQQPGDRRGDGAAAGRRRRAPSTRATRTYPGRAGGAGADVRAIADRGAHAAARPTASCSWVTRGLFVGEHHVYLAPQIDDFFLASQLYPMAGTYRITADDLQAFTNWQNARRADPLTAQFRAAFAFNAFGAKPAGRDGADRQGAGARARRSNGSTTPGITPRWTR